MTPTRPFLGLGSRDLIAALMLVVSLGLPWGFVGEVEGTVIPGYFVPGLCRTVWDYDGWASMECEPSVVGTPIFLPGAPGGALFGVEHPGRFGVAACLALLVFSVRRKSRLMRNAGIAFLLLVTTLTAGLGFFAAGSSLALLAAALLGAGSLPRVRENLVRI